MLTQEKLKEILDYDEDTGIFYWRYSPMSRIKIGQKAGYINNCGYVYIGINNKKYFAHRLAWLYMYGSFPKKQIDHINRNRSDNRICNLRDVSYSINNHNASIQKNNKSGCTGVYWHKNKLRWKAFIGINKKYKYLGYFKNIEDAIKARRKAENFI